MRKSAHFLAAMLAVVLLITSTPVHARADIETQHINATVTWIGARPEEFRLIVRKNVLGLYDYGGEGVVEGFGYATDYETFTGSGHMLTYEVDGTFQLGQPFVEVYMPSLNGNWSVAQSAYNNGSVKPGAYGWYPEFTLTYIRPKDRSLTVNRSFAPGTPPTDTSFYLYHLDYPSWGYGTKDYNLAAGQSSVTIPMLPESYALAVIKPAGYTSNLDYKSPETDDVGLNFQKDSIVLNIVMTYNWPINIAAMTGGSITAPSTAQAGQTVNVSVHPEANRRLRAGTLKFASTQGSSVISGTSFPMPASDVTLSAEFEPNYAITPGKFAGGTLTPSISRAFAGETVNVTAVPDQNRRLKAGTLEYIDGSGTHAISGTSFVMPAMDVALTAQFEPVYTVTAAETAGGTVTADTASAASGETVRLTVTPDFDRRYKDGTLAYTDSAGSHPVVNGYFTMPASDVTVFAEFEPIQYQVGVAPLTGGSIAADTATAASGQTVTLTVTPDGTNCLKPGTLKYNDGAADTAITGDSFAMPTSDVTVSAEFQSLHTLTAQPAPGGTVAADKAEAYAGDTVNLTITPSGPGTRLKSGSLFISDGTSDYPVSGTSFEMPDSDITYSGAFESEHGISISPSAGGTVTADKAAAYPGDTVNLSVTPDDGMQFTPGTLSYTDGGGTHGITGTSFAMPDSDVTVSAQFELKRYAVNFPPLSGGVITADKTDAVSGETVTLSITPGTGALGMQSLLQSGSLKYTDSTGDHGISGTSFVMPASDAAVSAVFEQAYLISKGTVPSGCDIQTDSYAYEGQTVSVVTVDGSPVNPLFLVPGSLKYSCSQGTFAVTSGSFTMPSEDVTVSARFEPKYSISIAPSANGTLSVDKNFCFASDQVSVTVTPGESCRLKPGTLAYSDPLAPGILTPLPGTGFTLKSLQPFPGNITLHAEFEQSCAITALPASGGTVSAGAAKAYEGDTVNLAVTPDAGMQLKPGSLQYTDAGGTHFIAGTSFVMPGTDVTVSAQFELRRYLVNIPASDGGVITADKADAIQGETVTVTAAPDGTNRLKPGSLKFTDSTGSHAISGTSFAMPASDVNVTGEFQSLHTVSAAGTAGGAVDPGSGTAYSGETVNLTVTPDTNYRLKPGTLKYTDGSGEHAVSGTSFEMPGEDVSVSAEFERLYKISVTPSTGGILTPGKAAAAAGEAVSLTVSPEADFRLKAGTLKIADSAGSHVLSGTGFSMPASDVTLTAEFEPQYTVSAAPFSGGTVTPDKAKAFEGDTVSLTVTPGFDKQFKDGSLKYSDGGGVHAITGASFVMPASDVTVIAEFEPRQYSVTIAPVSGGSIKTDKPTYASGETVTLVIDPKSGRRLKSGSMTYTDSTGSHPISGTGFVMPTGDVTVSAEFEAEGSISIARHSGGTVKSDKTKAYPGDIVTLTATPGFDRQYKAGSLRYTDTKGDHAITGTSFAMPEGDVTVSAEFEAQLYNVNIAALTDGSIAVDKKTAVSGETVHVTATPDAGMQLIPGTFTYAWNGKETSIQGNSFEMPAAEVTVSCKFGIPVSLATSALPEGLMWSGYSAALTARFGTPPYRFSARGLPGGLSVNASTGEISGSPCESGGFMVKCTACDSNGVLSEKTLPLRILKSFSVTFHKNGGFKDACPARVKVNEGGLIQTAPMPPQRAGYTFAGWYKDSRLKHAWNFNTDTVTANTVLYAAWDQNIYTVTFDAGGGSEVKPVTAAANRFLSPPKAPERSRYVFAGWYKDRELQLPWRFKSDMPMGGMTLFAKWEPAKIEKPASLSAKPYSESSITLAWKAANDADGYEISRSEYAGGPFYPIGTAEGTAYTDTGLVLFKTYYYKLRAIRNLDSGIAYSGYTAAVPAKTAQSAPAMLIASSAGDGKIHLSWNSVFSADGYEVYKAASLVSRFTRAAAVSDTQYTNDIAKQNQPCYYKVRAYHKEGKTKTYGDFSCIVSTSMLVSATIKDGAIITWAAVPGAVGYNLYRSYLPGGENVLIASLDKTTYTDTGITCGKQYSYLLKPYRLHGGKKEPCGQSVNLICDFRTP